MKESLGNEYRGISLTKEQVGRLLDVNVRKFMYTLDLQVKVEYIALALERRLQWSESSGREEAIELVKKQGERLRHELSSDETLSSNEYESVLSDAFRYQYVQISSLTPRNAKGCAKALSEVASRFPGLLVSGHLNFCGAQADQKKFAKAQAKYFNELAKNEHLGGIVKETREARAIVTRFKAKVSTWTIFYGEGGRVDKLIKKMKCWDQDFKKLLDETGNNCYPETVEKVCDLLAEKTFLEEKAREKAQGTVLLSDYDGYARRPSNAGAWCVYGQGVCISPDFEKDEINQLHKASCELGFHPKLDHPENGAEATMMHELGHAMDSFLGLYKTPEMKKLYRDSLKSGRLESELSRYGATDVYEMIAEGFCEYMLSSNPRGLAKTIGEFVELKYAEKIG